MLVVLCNSFLPYKKVTSFFFSITFNNTPLLALQVNEHIALYVYSRTLIRIETLQMVLMRVTKYRQWSIPANCFWNSSTSISFLFIISFLQKVTYCYYYMSLIKILTPTVLQRLWNGKAIWGEILKAWFCFWFRVIKCIFELQHCCSWHLQAQGYLHLFFWMIHKLKFNIIGLEWEDSKSCTTKHCILLSREVFAWSKGQLRVLWQWWGWIMHHGSEKPWRVALLV